MNGDRILLDTNIVSYIFRKHPLGEKYKPHIEGRLLFVSFITPAEMYYGAYKDEWGIEKQNRLAKHLRGYAVIPFNFEICRKWGDIKAGLWRERNLIKDNDIWIAATALIAGIPLITHDSGDFDRIPGLKIVTEPGGIIEGK